MTAAKGCNDKGTRYLHDLVTVLLVCIDGVKLGRLVEAGLSKRTLRVSRRSYLHLGLELLLLRLGGEGEVLFVHESAGGSHSQTGDDLKVSAAFTLVSRIPPLWAQNTECSEPRRL